MSKRAKPVPGHDLADEILRLSSLHAQTRGLLEQATANRDAIAEERNRIMDSQLKELAVLRANLASALRRLEILAFVIDEQQQQQQRMLPPCPHPDDALVNGPRISLRWGTAPTKMCCACGAWRDDRAGRGAWQPATALAAYFIEED